MKYRLFLFDADDTLFDFQSSEKLSFHKTLENLKLTLNFDDIFKTYRTVSAGLWQLLEQGKTNKDHLKVERFRKTFSQHNVDYDPEAASTLYLDILPETVVLNSHALEICQFLSQQAEIGIITNGIESVQRRRLKNSGLDSYISFMTISETCGFAKPDVRFFEQVVKQARTFQKSSSLVIGDRMETDIAGAHNFGIDSCLYNPNRTVFSHSLKPKFEISHLAELKDLIL